MKKQIYEIDLFPPIRDFLLKNGYQIRSEVNYCDIVAIRNNEMVIVELKKSLTIELLIQATKRQKIADAVYIAVPKPKNIFTAKWKDICHLIRRLELGLILVSFPKDTSSAEVIFEPKPFDQLKSRQQNKKNRARTLNEFTGRNTDLNIGGSKAMKLVTAYRENAIYIAYCIDHCGPLTIKQLKELGSDCKKTSSILQKNFYSWFIRVKKGVYDLSPQGKASLGQYTELTEINKTKFHANFRNN